MMKRSNALLLSCLMLAAMLMAPFIAVHSAYADLIIEPDNDFYRQHERQIVNLGRSFTANGEGGSVPVRKDPGARNDIAAIPNGDVAHVQYSCLYGGVFWGFAPEYSGWVKMDQLLVLYDYVAFEESHLDEFYPYEGDYNEIKEARAAVAWPWPGADAYLWSFDDLDAENFWVSFAYMDEEGREWGFVTYLYGSRNIWVCLSEPLNRGIPAFNPALAPTSWVSDTTHVDIRQDVPGNGSWTLAVIIALVTVLVAGTAVLIKVFWKQNEAARGGKADG